MPRGAQWKAPIAAETHIGLVKELVPDLEPSAQAVLHSNNWKLFLNDSIVQQVIRAGDELVTRLWHFSCTGCVPFRRCHARITTAAKERRRMGQLPLQGRMWPIRPLTAAVSGSVMRCVGEKGPKSNW